MSPTCGALDCVVQVDEVELCVDGEIPVWSSIDVASDCHEVRGDIVVSVQTFCLVRAPHDAEWSPGVVVDVWN